jgi:predicted nucleic acid-binding protein
MPEVISNTSPLQYLFQLDLLELLPQLYGEVLVPEGVVRELRTGASRGVPLPNLKSLGWLHVCTVKSIAVLPLAAGLGAGEREVLALALECEKPLVVLDDALARRFARRLSLPLTGTLGLLLRAKQSGRIETVGPYLDRLEALRFRLDPSTRADVLELAGELSGG